MRGILIGLGLLLTVSATAAPPAVKKHAPSATKKAAGGAVVDVVALRNGRTLRGGILQHPADHSVTMAVSRSWLKTAYPELFEEYDAANLTTQREAWGEARDRLKEFLATPPESQRLTFFLQSELQQLEDRLAAEDPKRADFIWVELPGAQVAKVTPATPEHQRLAVIAWNEGFVDIETQDAASLQRELTKRQIKLDGPTPDISLRLPARSQDEQEWSARLAVIEYVHRQPLDFQGMGDMLVPVGGGQKPDLAIIFHKLMQQQMNTLMRDLLNDRPRLEPVKPDRESFAPAIATAEAKGVRGFRVTRLEMEPDRNRVGVETRFVAKLGDDRWQTVFTATEYADSNQPRPELEARIAKDPQVKSMLQAMSAIGIVDDAPLQTAIRNGAATQVALQAADQAFSSFTNRYAQHVDRPKLFLPEP